MKCCKILLRQFVMSFFYFKPIHFKVFGGMGDGGMSHSYNKTEHSNWEKCVIMAQNIAKYKTDLMM